MNRIRTFFAVPLIVMLSVTSFALADDRPSVVVIVGAEGSPEFGEQFKKWADRWDQAAKLRSAQIVQIGREPESSNASDRQKLQSLLEKEPKDGTQPLWIVLIGHGTYDGREAKFNLRGPDFTDIELAEWLKPFTRPLALIDCSSSSAPFVGRVAARDRIVITATRTGSEINYARFGDYLSTAITDSAADQDKDGQTSLLEAFLAASHGVDEFYKQGGRLVTEHALLDDNGDGMGIASSWFEGLRATRSARDGAPLDGPRAHQWHLVLSPSEQVMSPDVRAKRDQLELAIESLRSKKAVMPEAEYYVQLEKLLLELAKIYHPSPGGQQIKAEVP